MPQNDLPKPLSRHQYGDLKFIHSNTPTLAYLRKANANTLSSLAYRGYLRRHGAGDAALVFLTALGEEALASYEQAGLNQRQHERELTERCIRLLQHSRRQNVIGMKKTA